MYQAADQAGPDSHSVVVLVDLSVLSMEKTTSDWAHHSRLDLRFVEFAPAATLGGQVAVGL